MSIQMAILSRFPAYLQLQKFFLARDQAAKEHAAEASRLRIECRSLAKDLHASRCEVFQLRRELQAEKLRNELPKVYLSKNQILKLMATSNLDSQIHQELEQTYEKLVQLQLRKERQSDSL